MELLKVAIQKSGRLSEKSLALLSECGIGVDNGDRKLVSRSWNYPVELFFLRDDDIPQYVADGVADAGIVGENILAEKGISPGLIEKLGFGRCRLSLAVPRNSNYLGLEWFAGKKIATSYPFILKKFLEEKKVDSEIHEISGSVEIAPGIGLADGIFDIVSSGSTLISNGLTEVETVMKSEAVLFRHRDLPAGVQETLDNLLFRIRAVQRAKNNRYILLNAPNSSIEKITSVIPGMKSPTIMPLAREGWSSVHSVVTEHDFWEVIGQLKELGAEGILVIPIEKMIL
jgi:ATP phosphoribosyltransferase